MVADTPWDWNYTTTAQPGLDNRAYPYPRGRLLGGSSSASTYRTHAIIHLIKLLLDYMIHQYGTNEDWDRMANVSGDNGWSWSNMKQYIDRVREYLH